MGRVRVSVSIGFGSSVISMVVAEVCDIFVGKVFSLALYIKNHVVIRV